jgi:hypothetical protein
MMQNLDFRNSQPPQTAPKNRQKPRNPNPINPKKPPRRFPSFSQRFANPSIPAKNITKSPQTRPINSNKPRNPNKPTQANPAQPKPINPKSPQTRPINSNKPRNPNKPTQANPAQINRFHPKKPSKTPQPKPNQPQKPQPPALNFPPFPLEILKILQKIYAFFAARDLHLRLFCVVCRVQVALVRNLKAYQTSFKENK